MIGMNKKPMNPDDPNFDYEEWKKEQGIKPAISISISLPKKGKEMGEDCEMDDEESEDEDDPEEYKSFLAENNIKPASESLKKAVDGLLNKKKKSI